MTVEEIASVLHVSLETVRNLCKSGELEYIKVGRQFRIHPDTLKKYLDRSADRDT